LKEKIKLLGLKITGNYMISNIVFKYRVNLFLAGIEGWKNTIKINIQGKECGGQTVNGIIGNKKCRPV
jgi:hypothetical protein